MRFIVNILMNSK